MSRASNLSRVKNLLTFATRKGWLLPVKLDFDRVRVDMEPPRILTVDEARKLLAVTREHAPDALPIIALGLFAGIRPEEAIKLTWGDVNLDEGHVNVSAAVSKVRQRRIVPLPPCAVAWLRLGGRLPITEITASRRVRRVRDRMGWTAWPKDVLRHSAASYLLAREQDTAKVALWLGNSPTILFRHYRELVYDSQAKEFFALMP